jgi:hypothetical protein
VQLGQWEASIELAVLSPCPAGSAAQQTIIRRVNSKQVPVDLGYKRGAHTETA